MSKLLDKNSQKNIVITGASSGIGKATAILMAREGHQVIATSRHREKLNPLIEETNSIGCPIFPEELNINKNDEVDQCFARLFERFGSVDVLVNNAGYGLKGSINSITSEQLQEQFNTNLFAYHPFEKKTKTYVKDLKRLGRNLKDVIFIDVRF